MSLNEAIEGLTRYVRDPQSKGDYLRGPLAASLAELKFDEASIQEALTEFFGTTVH